MPKDNLVDEAAKVPGRMFEWIVDGIVDGIKAQFGPSSPSSSPGSKDDKDSGGGGLFCNVPSHKE